jgi:uridine kinase
LAWTLRHMHVANVQVVSLDGWIKPLEKRGQGSVLHRFEMKNIETILEKAVGSDQQITIPLYDRQRRAPSKTYSIQVRPSDICILEGVVALLLGVPSGRRTVRIYVARNETARRAAMVADYRLRGFSDKQFADLYAERQLDEVPIIRQTQSNADFVIETK